MNKPGQAWACALLPQVPMGRHSRCVATPTACCAQLHTVRGAHNALHRWERSDPLLVRQLLKCAPLLAQQLLQGASTTPIHKSGKRTNAFSLLSVLAANCGKKDDPPARLQLC